MLVTARIQCLVLVLGSTALCAWAAACSSGTVANTTNADGGSQGDASSSSDGTAGGDSSTQGDAGSSPDSGVDGAVDPDKSCYSLTPNACGNCCSQHHPTGDQVQSNAFDMCICSAPHCAVQCALTDCSSAADAGSSMPGDPCDLCQTALLGDGGACTIAIDTACKASPDCVAFDHCNNLCP